MHPTPQLISTYAYAALQERSALQFFHHSQNPTLTINTERLISHLEFNRDVIPHENTIESISQALYTLSPAFGGVPLITVHGRKNSLTLITTSILKVVSKPYQKDRNVPFVEYIQRPQDFPNVVITPPAPLAQRP